MKKEQKEFKKELESRGLKLIALTRTGGDHYKAIIEGDDGKRITYFLASSVSDNRAARNRMADIKRFMNN